MLASVFSHLASRRLAVSEVLCKARGDASCTFIAVPDRKRDALDAMIASGERDVAVVVRNLQRASVRG